MKRNFLYRYLSATPEVEDESLPPCHLPGCYRPSTETVRGCACCAYHAVLKRAGWQCEAIIEKRLHPGKFMRCPCMGSEISVGDAFPNEARCPRHAHI